VSYILVNSWFDLGVVLGEKERTDKVELIFPCGEDVQGAGSF